jgi:peptide/nickel transport system ATP-binding protein
MAEPILQVDGLTLDYRTPEGPLQALRGLTFAIHAGESLGIVGESGSGKSTLAYAVMRYLAPNARFTAGTVQFKGDDLLALAAAPLRRLRGRRIAMVYQDPDSALNPALTVGQQMTEGPIAHGDADGDTAHKIARDRLAAVNIPEPSATMRKYPHQLSGGQKQRVVIAMALCGDPDLLILDEPTTALDVTTEAKILDLIEDLKDRIATAILYITHDLGVIARIADRVAVIYAGEVVETAGVEQLLGAPRHPYTWGLLDCIPGMRSNAGRRLPTIPGTLPDMKSPPTGCIFAPRCAFAQPRCREPGIYLQSIGAGRKTACIRWSEIDALRAQGPEANGRAGARPVRLPSGTDETGPILRLQDLERHYGLATGFSRWLGAGRQPTRAVDGVSLDVRPGETVGLVGESGSGKTTIAETVVGLGKPTGGSITFKGQPIDRPAADGSGYRRRARIVFQNPDSSLNPKKTIREILARPLKAFKIAKNVSARETRLRELMEMVRLTPAYLDRFPGELSGGEKQRIAIARAFATEPELVVCDEPTSALDVSVQASVLNLLVDLQERYGTAYLFISHDLGVVRHIADRVVILYLGQVMEAGPVEDVFNPPHHPYTRALLSSIPIPDPHQAAGDKLRLPGTVPSAKAPPGGCPFHTRCPQKVGQVCEAESPPVRRAGDHEIACHIDRSEL